jgi:RNA polymerase subunit RPABC4/transcription elongation factor Spt4
MNDRFVKTFELTDKGISGTKLATKEQTDGLRGKFVFINTEESEIAQKLDVTERGVFGAKFR